jgi:hypothetical protein
MDLSKVTWVVEQDVFLKNEKAIKEAVQKYGMTYYPYYDCDIKNSMSKLLNDLGGNADCVISYACLDVMSKFRREIPYTPTSYATFNNFKCSTYYPHYQDYLLATEYAFYPFGVLDSLKDDIFDKFGEDGKIFIRPDSGMKIFTGKVLEQGKCENGILDALKGWIYYDIPPEELVLVAKPSRIVKEYRFIAAGGEVISGSQYMALDSEGNLVHDEKAEYAQNAWNLAQKVAKEEWTPDRIFSIDIAELNWHDGEKYGPEYKLIEINAFSTCDWYLCNVDKVINKASEIAL